MNQLRMTYDSETGEHRFFAISSGRYSDSDSGTLLNTLSDGHPNAGAVLKQIDEAFPDRTGTGGGACDFPDTPENRQKLKDILG